LFEVFRKNSAVDVGRITRKKINEIILKAISSNQQDYFNKIGDKLTVIKGNPGTGKTIHLVHLANHLQKKRDFKCLILTFNKALQQDIKRLIITSNIASDNSITINTWDAFAYQCLNELETPADNNFQEWTTKLLEYINLSANPRSDFKTANSFDCVLVDEGQDWSNEKKEILYKLFGHKFTIVAIGENQEITNFKQSWIEGIARDERQSFTLEESHRNKNNLVDFFEEYSSQMKFNWQLKRNPNLNGGRILLTDNYCNQLHTELVNDLQTNENSFYDMLFLGGRDELLTEIKEKLNSFGQKGFIANASENRTKMFPIDEFRILTYQACRGLEGWTVVCYKLDLYLEDILKRHQNNDVDFNEELNRRMFVLLTRAIDTLVITMADKNSDMAKKIIRVISKLKPGRFEMKL
jgi:superfamily I DNA/RNA helicase